MAIVRRGGGGYTPGAAPQTWPGVNFQGGGGVQNFRGGCAKIVETFFNAQLFSKTKQKFGGDYFLIEKQHFLL
jgi:hypothetical protein